MRDIIIATMTITGISALLALLLSIAQQTIGNYGVKTLTINDEKQMSIDGGKTLLGSLVENEVFIPSACGGKGSCGYCKVKVVSGGGSLLPTETGYVTESEAAEGIRLSCQIKVKEDIHIQIPEALFHVKQFDYTVQGLDPLTNTIRHVRLSLPEDKSIEFKAGQYVQLLAPTYPGNEEEVYRAYSIASSPKDTHGIELFIGFVPGGKCSTYVHQHLRVGQKLTVVGPFGDFHYRDNDRDMVLVAIGTGLAPIMAILRHMKDAAINRPCTLYFGARNHSDLYMMDELRQMSESMANFSLIPMLSQPKPEDMWTGEVGRVNDALDRLFEYNGNQEAYLCGNPKMIDGVVAALTKKGMPEDLIYFDKFE